MKIYRPERERLKPGHVAPDLKIVSDHIFTKYKGNALTSEAFAAFIEQNDITDFYLTGGDATACVKSTCFNLRKLDYDVTVITDGITSYNKKKLPEMIEYYAKKGSHIIQFNDLLSVD
ncbi:isochorismatase family protein [Exiguobacterium sp. RIT452]|uniref:isochorismatase family protein n=1 Tax=Exiguobacterium sp. RIT452 TaxID=2315552 RepID=UPI0021012687|nr:isochorismatase family protein [Exiguobacterium sp. RIT452]